MELLKGWNAIQGSLYQYYCYLILVQKGWGRFSEEKFRKWIECFDQKRGLYCRTKENE